MSKPPYQESEEDDRIRRFLKKDQNKPQTIRQFSDKDKDDFLKRKLYAEIPRENSYKNKTFFQRLRSNLDQRWMMHSGRSFNAFMRETFPLLAFISFSTYILYKMEKEYDSMVRSVIQIKTIKEEQSEKEDKYIRSVLAKEEFNHKRQIQDAPDKITNYKFEDMDQDEEDGDLNTRDDFLDALRKDYNKGIQIPQEYQQDVFAYAMRERKPLGFNQKFKEDEDDDSQDLIIGSNSNQERETKFKANQR